MPKEVRKNSTRASNSSNLDTRVGLLEGNYNCYASLYEDSSGTNIVLTTAGTFYKWVSSTKGLDSGLDYIYASGDSDEIVVGPKGIGTYFIAISSSFRGSNNSNIHGSVFKGGVEVGSISFHRKLGGNDVGSASASGLLELNKGDVIDVRFDSDTDATTVTVEHVQLTMFRLNRQKLL